MYKFQPILKSTIWGGEKIVPYKHIASDQKQVGESWELSGATARHCSARPMQHASGRSSRC